MLASSLNEGGESQTDESRFLLIGESEQELSRYMLIVAREDEKLAGALSLNEIEHEDDCEQASQFYSGARTAPPQTFTADDVEQVLSESSSRVGTVGFATARPLFSQAECQAIIEEAEAVASSTGGWSTKRHSNYPTTDIPVLSLPNTKRWMDQALETRIFPFLAHCFPESCADADSFRMNDIFVVKYNASSGQTQLNKHRDGGLISVNIALNPKSDFSGGGTALFGSTSGEADDVEAEPASVARIDEGHMLAHSSSIMHSGVKIDSGVRYVLVGFTISATEVEHRRRMTERSTLMMNEGLLLPARRLMRLCSEEGREREGESAGRSEAGAAPGVKWVGGRAEYGREGRRVWGAEAYENNVGPPEVAARKFEGELCAKVAKHQRRLQLLQLLHLQVGRSWQARYDSNEFEIQVRAEDHYRLATLVGDLHEEEEEGKERTGGESGTQAAAVALHSALLRAMGRGEEADEVYGPRAQEEEEENEPETEAETDWESEGCLGAWKALRKAIEAGGLGGYLNRIETIASSAAVSSSSPASSSPLPPPPLPSSDSSPLFSSSPVAASPSPAWDPMLGEGEDVQDRVDLLLHDEVNSLLATELELLSVAGAATSSGDAWDPSAEFLRVPLGRVLCAKGARQLQDGEAEAALASFESAQRFDPFSVWARDALQFARASERANQQLWAVSRSVLVVEKWLRSRNGGRLGETVAPIGNELQ